MRNINFCFFVLLLSFGCSSEVQKPKDLFRNKLDLKEYIIPKNSSNLRYMFIKYKNTDSIGVTIKKYKTVKISDSMILLNTSGFNNDKRKISESEMLVRNDDCVLLSLINIFYQDDSSFIEVAKIKDNMQLLGTYDKVTSFVEKINPISKEKTDLKYVFKEAVAEKRLFDSNYLECVVFYGISYNDKYIFNTNTHDYSLSEQYSLELKYVYAKEIGLIEKSFCWGNNCMSEKLENIIKKD